MTREVALTDKSCLRHNCLELYHALEHVRPYIWLVVLDEMYPQREYLVGHFVCCEHPCEVSEVLTYR